MCVRHLLHRLARPMQLRYAVGAEVRCSGYKGGAGCNATNDDVVKVLRATLKKSYLPLCICDHMLETVQIVTYASDTLAELNMDRVVMSILRI